MTQPAPPGPLVGDELRRATELLTPKQLLVYRYRREGHALNWIARRMSISRTRVVHLIGAAEHCLGYALSVTPKQKAAYRPVARRRQETHEAWQMYLDELAAQLEPEELERIAEILDSSASDEELQRRLGERLSELQGERQARAREYLPAGAEHDDDWSAAVGEADAEFAADLEADFGINPVTGDAMRPEDFVEDDGKGYDRL